MLVKSLTGIPHTPVTFDQRLTGDLQPFKVDTRFRYSHKLMHGQIRPARWGLGIFSCDSPHNMGTRCYWCSGSIRNVPFFAFSKITYLETPADVSARLTSFALFNASKLPYTALNVLIDGKRDSRYPFKKFKGVEFVPMIRLIDHCHPLARTASALGLMMKLDVNYCIEFTTARSQLLSIAPSPNKRVAYWPFIDEPHGERRPEHIPRLTPLSLPIHCQARDLTPGK